MTTKTKQTKGRRAHDAKCIYCKQHHEKGAPYYIKSRDAWAVTIGPNRYRLVAKGFEGHDYAMQEWRNGAANPSKPKADQDGESLTLAYLADEYFAWLKAEHEAGKKAPKTISKVESTLTIIKKQFGKETVASLRKGGTLRLENFVKAYSASWGDGHKESVFKIIRRVFNFAVKRLQVIASSPLPTLNCGEDKVACRARVNIFSDRQIDTILKAARKGRVEQFADVLEVLLGTGCRPNELCKMTAADMRIDELGGRYVLCDHKTQDKAKWAGQRRPVRIMTKRLEKIFLDAAKANPKGPLFKNSYGNAWTEKTILDLFRSICERTECVELGLAGFDVLNGKRNYHYVIYSYRHTFATRCLSAYYKDQNGHPVALSCAQTADLMGNSAAVVEKTYSKLSKTTPALVARLFR